MAKLLTAVGTVLLSVGLVATACALTTQPAPVVSPSESAPAQVAKPSVAPMPVPEWKAEWDKTVAAAMKEGTVVVSGAEGDRFRSAAMQFEKSFPGIKVEYSGTPAGDKAAKIIAERQAGLYLWDVYGGGWTTIATGLSPALAPLRPVMILPEVVDDGKWLSGFDAGFIDDHTFGFFAYWFHGAYVNGGIAPKSELNTVDDLLDPRWKGKIAWGDPRTPGAGRAIAADLVAKRGEDFLRKLLAQDVLPIKDTRGLAEGLVRGRYAVAFGVRVEDLATFRETGLIANIEPLEGMSYVATGSGHVGLFDKAPHPNAARVFINWLLSREGQTIHAQYADTNSRRLDVDGPRETAVPPGYKYSDSQFVQWPYNDKVVEISQQMLR